MKDADYDETTATTSLSSGEESDENKNEKKQRYACKKCDFRAEFPNRLRRHMKTVHNEKVRYRCVVDDCKEGFRTYPEMRSHLRDFHPILHKCAFCLYENKTKASVRRHMILNHKNGVPCTFDGCGIKVAKNRLRKHIREEHTSYKKVEVNTEIIAKRGADLKCPHCDYLPHESKIDTEMRREDVNLHIETIHRSGVKCPLKCGKTLKIDNLDEHLSLEHANEINEMMPPMKRIAMTDSTRTSSTEDETMSSQEDKLEDIENDVIIEETTTTPLPPPTPQPTTLINNRNMWNCEKCGKSYMSKDSLRKHQKTVHEKSYSINLQSKVKKFKCNFDEGKCNKSFTTTGLLEDHINWHKGEKPFKCNTCHQEFHARARFAVHLKKYHQTSIKELNFVDKNLF